MNFTHMKRFSMFASLLFVLLLTACGNNDSGAKEDGADSEETLSEQMNYTITGIEPGAGITVTTEAAMEQYDSLQGWDLELSSTAAMMSELDRAIKNEEPIVITGWNPHWMFAKFPDLKYLEDPLNAYGGEENINSLARAGLKEDKPNAYQFIEQFAWEVEDMEAIMYESAETGEEIETIAEKWIADNADRVAAWSEGVAEGSGETVEIVSTPWDSERSSSAVLKIAMEQKGFKVNVTDVDVAVMFESVANGDADATAAAWLPMTHKDFYSKYEDKLEDLGPNLTGAKIGLVVPEYVDLTSIEELEAK